MDIYALVSFLDIHVYKLKKIHGFVNMSIKLPCMNMKFKNSFKF